MQSGRIITFSSVFGKSIKLPSSKDLLKDINSYFLIHYYSFINSVNFLKPQDITTEKWILEQIIFRFDGVERDFLVSKFADTLKHSRIKVATFFPLGTLLKCIVNELVRNIPGDFGQITKEQEFNILLNILVQNEEIDNEILKSLGKLDKSDPESVYKIIWTIQFPRAEFYQRKRISFALFKSIRFLDFIENEKKYKPFIKDFLDTYSINSSGEYLKNILLLLKNGKDPNKENFTSFFKKDYDKLNPLIRNFILSVDENTNINSSELQDYKILRKNPIIKFKDGSLAVTNWNFIIDKFYPSIIYDFFNNTKVKTLYKDKHGKESINSYLSDIGSNFAEDIMLKKEFANLMARGDCFIQFGNNKDKTYDIYLRIRKHILLIEFKNISLPKKTSFLDIKNIINNRLVKDGGSNKGILQLSSEIKQFQKNRDYFEDFSKYGINTKKLVIYPIIIYTDNSLNMHGVNSYLHRMF